MSCELSGNSAWSTPHVPYTWRWSDWGGRCSARQRLWFHRFSPKSISMFIWLLIAVLGKQTNSNRHSLKPTSPTSPGVSSASSWSVSRWPLSLWEATWSSQDASPGSAFSKTCQCSWSKCSYVGRWLSECSCGTSAAHLLFSNKLTLVSSLCDAMFSLLLNIFFIIFDTLFRVSCMCLSFKAVDSIA